MNRELQRRLIAEHRNRTMALTPTQFGAVFEGDTVTASAQFSRAAVAGAVALEIETADGDVFRQEVAMALPARPAEPAEPISTVARLAASARLGEPGPATPAETAVRYQLISDWTNWLVIAERAEGEKAQGIPAIRKVQQTMAAGWGGIGSVMATDMAPTADFAMLRRPPSAPAPMIHELLISAPRDRRPKPFRLLLDLIDSDPSRLDPHRALQLLDDAGLLPECEDLLRRGVSLGLEPNAIAAIFLAVLLDGPLREFLSPAEQRAVAALQAYADEVRAMLDEVTGRTDGLLQVTERAAGLGILNSRLAHEVREWVTRLDESRELFAQVEDVARSLAVRVGDGRKTSGGPRDRRK